MKSRSARSFASLCSLFALLAAASAAEPAARIELAAATAAPTALSFAGKAVPLAGTAGGFSVRDFNEQRDVDLGGGQITRIGTTLTYTARGDDLSLQATFTPVDGYIVVAGEIATQRAADRALIVRYTLPVPAAGASFQNDLSRTTKIGADTAALGTIFPLAAITGPEWGAALAIPPSFPCCFGLTGSARGLGVEFYLGLSPLVRAFPNRAAFVFLIDAAQPAWGFRSALAQYYRHFPDFYRPRTKAAGFWNWNDPVGLAQDPGPADEGLSLYTFHGFTHGATYPKQVARDRRLGVLSFGYTIVGMREITGLPELPADDDAAMGVYHTFAQAWQAEGPDGPLHKKYAGSNERNRDLPAQIEASTVFNADGHFRLRRRNSAWGANSVTFVENPNPHLFEDKGTATVGGVTLKMVGDWFAHDPAPGVHLDSLGSQWPSCVNYRTEHFPYAQFPLTFDKNGRVVLHNMISHYEFVAAVDVLARQHDKLVFGNGIDIYESRRLEEHYNGLKNGRFFLAAQLDVGGREIEDDVLTRERLDAFRTCLGPKPMTAVLYRWQNPHPIKVDMNRALAYDIFAAPNRFFGDQISYIGAANGYARDRELVQWASKNAQLLQAAGWQPVTHARVDQPDVVCERYGTGDVFYFTLLNLGKAPVDCQLDVDMGALDISPQGGEMSYFSEVARKAPLETSTEGDTGHVRLKLQPDEANIVKLSRAW